MDDKMSKKTKSKCFLDPWANLAAAILHSGVACQDELFLKSKWAATLADIVEMADARKDYATKQNHEVML